MVVLVNESQLQTIHDARTVAARAPLEPLRVWLGVGLAAGLFLGLVGALDSYNYSWQFRIVFWTTLSLIAATTAAVIEMVLDRFRWRGERNPWRWGLLAFALTLIMTPVAYLSNSLGGARPTSELLMFAINALIISVALVAVRAFLGESDSPSRRSIPSQRKAPSLPAFANRLPPALTGGTIRALQAEGHYVRVFTDKGSDLVLFRLKDSIDELGGVEGAQVHRSWWVARDAVKTVRRRQGRTWLVLDDELIVPVSRPNVSVLKDRGWI